MNFLADENVDRQIVERLRQEDHKVEYVAEIDSGITEMELSLFDWLVFLLQGKQR